MLFIKKTLFILILIIPGVSFAFCNNNLTQENWNNIYMYSNKNTVLEQHAIRKISNPKIIEINNKFEQAFLEEQLYLKMQASKLKYNPNNSDFVNKMAEYHYRYNLNANKKEQMHERAMRLCIQGN